MKKTFTITLVSGTTHKVEATRFTVDGRVAIFYDETIPIAAYTEWVTIIPEPAPPVAA